MYRNFGFGQNRTLIDSEEIYTMKTWNWHSIKMYSMIGITFAIGGLSALKGSTAGDWTTALSVLLFVQHLLGGNSSLTS